MAFVGSNSLEISHVVGYDHFVRAARVHFDSGCVGAVLPLYIKDGIFVTFANTEVACLIKNIPNEDLAVCSGRGKEVLTGTELDSVDTAFVTGQLHRGVTQSMGLPSVFLVEICNGLHLLQSHFV